MYLVVFSFHCYHCVGGLNICVLSFFLFLRQQQHVDHSFFVIFDRSICWGFVQVILDVASITRETSCFSCFSLHYDYFYLLNYFWGSAVLGIFFIINPFHEKSSLIFPLRSNKFSYFHLKKEFLASESNLFHSIFRTG